MRKTRVSLLDLAPHDFAMSYTIFLLAHLPAASKEIDRAGETFY